MKTETQNSVAGNNSESHKAGRKQEEVLQDLTDESDHENSHSDEDEDRALCLICGLIYPDDGGFWIGCNGCNDWFDLKSTDVKSKQHVSDVYYCEKC